MRRKRKRLMILAAMIGGLIEAMRPLLAEWSALKEELDGPAK